MKPNSPDGQSIDSYDASKLFRHIVEDIEVLPIFVYEFKLDGKCVYVNKACCTHFQRSKEFLLGQRMRDFSSTFSDGELPEETIHSLIAGNKLTFEDAHINATGELIPVEVTLHYFRENNLDYAVAYCIDLRERKKIERQNIEIEKQKARLEAESYFKRLVESYPDPLVRTNLNGEITYAHDEVSSHFGYAAEDIYGRKLADLEMSAELKSFAHKLTEAAIKVAKENRPYTFEQWTQYNQERAYAEVRHIPERDKFGNAVGVLGFSRIITEKAIQNDILRSLAQSSSIPNDIFFDQFTENLKTCLELDYVVLLTLDRDEDSLTINASTDKHLSNKHKRFPLDLPLFKAATQSAVHYQLNCENRHLFDIDLFIDLGIESLAAIPLPKSNDALIGFLLLLSKSQIQHFDSVQNIVNLIANTIVAKVEKIRYEEAESIRAEDFRVLVECSPDFISRFDKHFNCVYVNPALAQLGFKPGSAEEYAHADFKGQVDEVLLTGIDSVKIYQGIDPRGEVYNVETRVICERDIEGGIAGAIVIARDISDRMALEDKLRKQADTDSLTELPNRRAFTERLNYSLANAKRSKNHLGLLFIDLDRFKTINDTLGHDMGDELLREAAERLKSATRESDMVARFGGDEFVVLLTSLNNPVEIGSIAEAIIETLAQPYNLDSMTTYISASIGIASFPTDTGSGSELIAHADQAMYIAKQQGRNTFRFFTPSMQAEADERLVMLNELRVALERGQLHMVFQPIIQCGSDQIQKAEALLRWRHPEKGYIRPDKFIPLAEDTGLIDEIGDWVFKQSTEFAKKWREQSAEDIQVSINVSPRQFNQTSIVSKWISWLNDINLPAKHISLEVTETLLLGQQEDLQTKLNQFREAGIQLALDDFGTGYSAMSYLKKFPIDYLKIDGSFIRDMTCDNNDRAIVETIVVMASRLGMKSIAECVETSEQSELLMSYGCDYIQGYLYSPPLRQEDFLIFTQTLNAS